MFGFMKKKTAAIAAYPEGFVCGTAKGKYCIIDISGGINADKFPVLYCDAAPEGGWGDECRREKLVLRLVPASSFKMGLERNYYNKPHDVTLSNPYYFGMFPITISQYEKVMGARPAGCDEYLLKCRKSEYEVSPAEHSYEGLRGGQNGLSWPQSNEVSVGTFIEVIRRKSGIANLDLPTNAQWDFAAHGGTDSPVGNLANGSIPALSRIGHFDSECRPDGSDPEYMGDDRYDFPVGLKEPNRFGIYDTIGNSTEWVLDWCGDLGVDGLSDPAGPEDCVDSPGGKGTKFRVTRGVSAGSSKRGDPINVREETSASPSSNMAFRIAFTVES